MKQNIKPFSNLWKKGYADYFFFFSELTSLSHYYTFSAREHKLFLMLGPT